MIKALENWGTFSIIAYRKQLYWGKYMVACIKVTHFWVFPGKTAVVSEETPQRKVKKRKRKKRKRKKRKREKTPLGKSRGVNFNRLEQGGGCSEK